MLEETKKKLYLWGIIALAVMGAMFVLWAVFLNRGKLTVIAKAPYIVQIRDLRSENCATDECTMVVAPGDYTMLVQKAGYLQVEAQVSVPIGGEHREEVNLKYIPIVTSLGDEASLHLFSEPKVDAKDLPDVPLFFEKNYVVYLDRNPENKRQTLYVRGIQDGKLGDENAVTSFPRTIKSYTIIPGIEKNNLIAVIEQTDEGSALYIVNLSDKSRTNLLELPLIANVMWLPESENFLVEARQGLELNTSIFLYGAEKKDLTKLNLQTSLANVAALSNERLIATTNQTLLGGDPVKLEGQLVQLGEVEATPSALTETAETATTTTETASTVTPTTAVAQMNIVDYSLIANQARLIKSVSSFGIPEKTKIGSDGKSILILVRGQVYQVKFED